MSKPRLLDLFCGAGGAAMGYHRAGFEVVGVDVRFQPRYPFEFHQADAMTFPLEGFDAIHASPPCQGYSLATGAESKARHPRLIIGTIERLASFGRPYAVENVMGSEVELPASLLLCGTMFGLAVRRHRLFATSHMIMSPHHPPCLGAAPFQAQREAIVATGLAAATDPRVWAVAGHGRRKGTARVWAMALGMGDIDVGQKQASEAIPPAYTEFIGVQLRQAIEHQRTNPVLGERL